MASKKTIICLTVALILTSVGLIVCVSHHFYFRTTPFKAKIMNKCKTITKNSPTSQKDCEKIWDSFTQAFVGKDPSDVPPEAYNCLIQTVSEVSEEPACNRMMFWSGTKKIVHAFTERSSYVTLEDTLLGFLDGVEVRWCGKKGSQEIFTTGCPNRTDSGFVNNPVESFWIQASAAFAASACGDAFVMLDGSIKEPYDRSSMFGDVEVENFNLSKMKSLKALLVTEQGDTRKTCEIEELKKDLQEVQNLQKLQKEYKLRKRQKQKKLQEQRVLREQWQNIVYTFNFECKIVSRLHIQPCIADCW